MYTKSTVQRQIKRNYPLPRFLSWIPRSEIIQMLKHPVHLLCTMTYMQCIKFKNGSQALTGLNKLTLCLFAYFQLIALLRLDNFLDGETTWNATKSMFMLSLVANSQIYCYIFHIVRTIKEILGRKGRKKILVAIIHEIKFIPSNIGHLGPWLPRNINVFKQRIKYNCNIELDF